MAIEITMPQLSDTMNDGKILAWRKKVGDPVKRGDTLAEVATDKADLEIEAFHEGTLLQISVDVGTTVRVGSVIAVIGEANEAVPAGAASAPVQQAAPVQSAPVQAPVQSAPIQSAPVQAAPPPPPVHHAPNGSGDGERVKISPLAKNVAENHGVDYTKLKGSGEGGRIVRRDVEGAIGGQTAAPQAAYNPPAAPQQTSSVQSQPPQAAPRPQLSAAGRSVEPLSRMRQTIATRMVEAKTGIPHFYVTSKIVVDPLLKLKDTLKPLSQYEGITFNHLIVRGVALALRRVPRVNSAYSDGNLIQPQDINIGIITAVTDGLLIPVLKNADQLQLSEVVSESRGLVQRARSGRPKADDLTGGTFSISNMGMFAVESFSAIINPGQGAILAVSSIAEEPIVSNGEIKAGKTVRMTLSVDHRIIDGVVAGEFMTELKRLLEEPVLLLA